jgi:hypothetical protein
VKEGEEGKGSAEQHEEIAQKRLAGLEAKLDELLSMPDPDAPPRQELVKQLGEGGESFLRERAKRLAALQARLDALKEERDSWREWARDSLLRDQQAQDRSATLDEAVAAAEREIYRAFRGLSILGVEMDGEQLWKKLASLDPSESGEKLIELI